VDRLCRDLSSWRDMFVAGRMQKPVSVLGTADPRVVAAAAANLRAALAAALLALPETFSTRQLHRALCGLSYGGDIRMALFAEDADKVARIAAGSRAALTRLYADAIEEVGRGAVGLTRTNGPGPRPAIYSAWGNSQRLGSGGQAVVRWGDQEEQEVEEKAAGMERWAGDCGAGWWGQDKGERARSRLLALIPVGVLACMRRRTGAEALGAGGEEVAAALAKRTGCHQSASRALRGSLSRVVRRSSLRQLLASALGTSPDKAVQYVASKVLKSVVSRWR